MDSYKNPPDGTKRVRPIKDRTELLKTNCDLGTEKTPYETGYMGQFEHPKDVKLKAQS